MGQAGLKLPAIPLPYLTTNRQARVCNLRNLFHLRHLCSNRNADDADGTDLSRCDLARHHISPTKKPLQVVHLQGFREIQVVARTGIEPVLQE